MLSLNPKETLKTLLDRLTRKIIRYVPAYQKLEEERDVHRNNAGELSIRLNKQKENYEKKLKSLETELEETKIYLSQESQARSEDKRFYQERLSILERQILEARNRLVAGIVSHVAYHAAQNQIRIMQTQLGQLKSLRLREILKEISPEQIAQLSENWGIKLEQELITKEREQRKKVTELESTISSLNSKLVPYATEIAVSILDKFADLRTIQSLIYDENIGVTYLSKPMQRAIKRGTISQEKLEEFAGQFTKKQRKIFKINEREVHFQEIEMYKGHSFYVGYIVGEGKSKKSSRDIIEGVGERFAKALSRALRHYSQELSFNS